jgi:hypothetical protein
MAGTMKSANPKATAAIVATGNKKPNKPAKVAPKASVKFEGPKSTSPKGAVPMKKMGGSKKSKC